MNLVSICVCTCRRPELLRNTLQSLGALVIPTNLAVEILVVDNDRYGSAAAVCSEMAPALRVALRYFVEPKPGVSFARNRCLAEARGSWIAFADDDEVVEPEWLIEHWAGVERFDADGVFGPVIAQFAEPPTEWLIKGGFHQRERLLTGTVLDWKQCRSGNVMFRKSLKETQLGFSESFAGSGGEDSEFFWRCLRGGAKFVWIDEACVREWVPPERLTREWNLMRAYLGGGNYTRVRASAIGKQAYVIDMARGLITLCVSLLPYLFFAVRRDCEVARYERRIAGALGKMMSLRALRTKPYAKQANEG